MKNENRNEAAVPLPDFCPVRATRNRSIYETILFAEVSFRVDKFCAPLPSVAVPASQQRWAEGCNRVAVG